MNLFFSHKNYIQTNIKQQADPTLHSPPLRVLVAQTVPLTTLWYLCWPVAQKQQNTREAAGYHAVSAPPRLRHSACGLVPTTKSWQCWHYMTPHRTAHIAVIYSHLVRSHQHGTVPAPGPNLEPPVVLRPKTRRFWDQKRKFGWLFHGNQPSSSFYQVAYFSR